MGGVFPTTTVVHAIRASCRPDRVYLGFTGKSAIPILAPFQNITRHVVQTQFVRLFHGNGMGCVIRVTAIPCHIVNVIAASILITLGLVATTSSIFPFGFSRQAEGLARQLVQPGNKRLTVIPRHPLHGTLQVASKITRVFTHHCQPQSLSHLGLGYIVRTGFLSPDNSKSMRAVTSLMATFPSLLTSQLIIKTLPSSPLNK